MAKPRRYSHGLTRLAYYRLARAVAAVLPRPVRLVAALARAGGAPVVPTMVAALEGAVRAHPTQWCNFFDVWAPPIAVV